MYKLECTCTEVWWWFSLSAKKKKKKHHEFWKIWSVMVSISGSFCDMASLLEGKNALSAVWVVDRRVRDFFTASTAMLLISLCKITSVWSSMFSSNAALKWFLPVHHLIHGRAKMNVQDTVSRMQTNPKTWQIYQQQAPLIMYCFFGFFC